MLTLQFCQVGFRFSLCGSNGESQVVDFCLQLVLTWTCRCPCGTGARGGMCPRRIRRACRVSRKVDFRQLPLVAVAAEVALAIELRDHEVSLQMHVGIAVEMTKPPRLQLRCQPSRGGRRQRCHDRRRGSNAGTWW